MERYIINDIGGGWFEAMLRYDNGEEVALKTGRLEACLRAIRQERARTFYIEQVIKSY